MPARGLCWLCSSLYPGFGFPVVRLLCLLGLLLPFPTTIESQTGPFASKTSKDDFQQTVRHSGLIFEGTVTAIHCELGQSGTLRNGATPSRKPMTYSVSFQVRQGLRGVHTGATLTIREWAGLWAKEPNRPRFRIGERAFLFLYPPSLAGLTSTVGGRKGKLAVRGSEAELPPDWVVSTEIAQGASRRVPVAWLVQHVAQAVLAPAGGE